MLGNKTERSMEWQRNNHLPSSPPSLIKNTVHLSLPLSLPLLLLHVPLASFELAKNLYVLLWPAEYGLYNPSQGPTPLAVLQQQ